MTDQIKIIVEMVYSVIDTLAKLLKVSNMSSTEILQFKDGIQHEIDRILNTEKTDVETENNIVGK